MYRWSDRIQNLAVWTGVIITYLFVEWVYNQHLLEILLRDNISAAQFEATEVFGKVIASLGINLFLIKIFHYSKKMFCAGVVVSYFMLTTLFNFAINSFSDEFRYSSYYSMLHRAEVVLGKDRDNLLAPANTNNSLLWYQKSLLMSYFVFTLPQEKWKLYEAQVKKPLTAKLQTLDKGKLWQKYQQINTQKKKLDSAYNKYIQGMGRYNAYKNGRYQKRAYQQFLKQSGGIPPDLEEIGFYKHVPGGKIYLDFLDKKLLDQAGNIPALYGRNIPLNLGKSEFNDYLDSQIQQRKIEIAPDLQDIRHNSQSENPVALLVIPPISIGLSLLSIILNAVLLIGSWVVLIPCLRINGKKFWLTYIMALCIFLYFVDSKSVTTINPHWQTMETQYIQSHPTMSYFWLLTQKFEPYICPIKPSNTVAHVTKILYGNQ